MKITVLTADYAQSDPHTGKINAIGIGWSTVGSPLPPHGVAVLISVDWNEANTPHHFVLDLLDADGHAVSLDGSGNPAVHIEGTFEQGRPPGVIPGTDLVQVFAVNFPGGIPLPANNRYEYRVAVGSEEASAPFSVIAPISR